MNCTFMKQEVSLEISYTQENIPFYGNACFYVLNNDISIMLET